MIASYSFKTLYKCLQKQHAPIEKQHKHKKNPQWEVEGELVVRRKQKNVHQNVLYIPHWKHNDKAHSSKKHSAKIWLCCWFRAELFNYKVCRAGFSKQEISWTSNFISQLQQGVINLKNEPWLKSLCSNSITFFSF